nr:DUF1295 domain-containing protein [Pseudarthrobacter psychrotolerans]
MSPFPWPEFVASLPWTALAVVAVLALTFAVAVRQGRHSVMDVAWGPGFVAVAVVSWFLSAGLGDDTRRLLLLLLTAVWGLRLGVHIGWRASDGTKTLATRPCWTPHPDPGTPMRSAASTCRRAW